MNNFDINTFKNPPEKYSVAPFWFLNGDLNESELDFQLREMKAKGVDECILHARKGLTIEYLSEEWFKKIGVILALCEKYGIKAWIYDEDNWPSGYAGGKVVEYNSDFRATCLTVEKIYPVLGEYINVPEKPGTKLECVIAVHSDSYFLDITDYKTHTAKPWRSETLCWEVFVFRTEPCAHKPAYSPLPYVDMLNPAATKRFVEVTHAEYKKRFPEYWGSVIKGFFTDEPGFYQNYLEQCANLNTLIWTPDFAERFIAKYGYDIRPHLCCLWQDMGTLSVKTRCDYYKAVADFYIDSFFGVMKDFLAKDGLKLIGHLHREDQIESLVQTESDFFSVISSLDYVGIDCIDRKLPRITERIASSAAHTRGKEICFSETFGGFGWSLSPQEMKARTDLQYVQGINMLVPHAFFYSVEGIRKQESPPSLFFQNGYWQYFRQYTDYVKRLSYLGMAGEYFADTVVYFPTKSSWAKYRPLYRFDLYDLDRQLVAIVDLLNKNRVNFDFYDDYAFENLSELLPEVKAIVLPKLFVMPVKDLAALERVLSQGVTVVSCGEFSPVDENGERSDEYAELLAKIAKHENFFVINEFVAEDIMPIIAGKIKDFVIDGNAKGVYANARKSQNAMTLLLVNTTEYDKTFTVGNEDYKYSSLLDLESGAQKAVDLNEGKAACKLTLAPYESKVVLFENKACGVFEDDDGVFAETPVVLDGEWTATFRNRTEKVPFDLLTAHAANLHNYSGEVVFSCKYKCGKLPYKAELFLCGKTEGYVGLKINGKTVGARLWSPFRFDVSDYLIPGENVVELTIGSTMENQMTDSDVDFGHFGYVVLINKE